MSVSPNLKKMLIHWQKFKMKYFTNLFEKITCRLNCQRDGATKTCSACRKGHRKKLLKVKTHIFKLKCYIKRSTGERENE